MSAICSAIFFMFSGDAVTVTCLSETWAIVLTVSGDKPPRDPYGRYDEYDLVRLAIAPSPNSSSMFRLICSGSACWSWKCRVSNWPERNVDFPGVAS